MENEPKTDSPDRLKNGLSVPDKAKRKRDARGSGTDGDGDDNPAPASAQPNRHRIRKKKKRRQEADPIDDEEVDELADSHASDTGSAAPKHLPASDRTKKVPANPRIDSATTDEGNVGIRPANNHNSIEDVDSRLTAKGPAGATANATQEPSPPPPIKRGPGRPRKEPAAQASDSASDASNASAQANRGRGRPPKQAASRASGSVTGMSASLQRTPNSLPKASAPVEASNATTIDNVALAKAFGPRRPRPYASGLGSPVATLSRSAGLQSPNGHTSLLQPTNAQPPAPASQASGPATQSVSASKASPLLAPAQVPHFGHSGAVAVGPPRARPGQNAGRAKPPPRIPTGPVTEIPDTDEEEEEAAAPFVDAKEALPQAVPSSSSHVEETTQPAAVETSHISDAPEQRVGMVLGTEERSDPVITTPAVAETSAAPLPPSARPAGSASPNSTETQTPPAEVVSARAGEATSSSAGPKPPLRLPGSNLALTDSVPPSLGLIELTQPFDTGNNPSSTPLVRGYTDPKSPAAVNAVGASGVNGLPQSLST